jgi:D-aminoacyl-tRNA deacylase
MIAVVQRVAHASVVVDGTEIGGVGRGFLVLVGIRHDDTEADCRWMSEKIPALRVFPDEAGKMNLAIGQLSGAAAETRPPVGILLVPNFTLCAATAKGNRPSFTDAMHPSTAGPMFDQLVELVRSKAAHVATGRFGADMKISLLNDGPVTLLLDSRQR